MIILYPYSQKGSDGYLRRFEEYLPYLKEDNISYKIQDICTDYDIRIALNGNSKRKYYLFLLKVFRIRIKQTIQIRLAQKGFCSKKFIPFVLRTNESYTRKIGIKALQRGIYDYWDSVWVNNEELNRKTVKIADTISVANEYLFSHYSKSHLNVKFFNIGINLKKYILKTTYDKQTDFLRLFYTGSLTNVRKMLKEIGDFLVDFQKEIKSN